MYHRKCPKIIAISITLLFGCGIASVWSAPKQSTTDSTVHLSAGAIAQKSFGQTSYDLLADQGGGTIGLSRLEFPDTQAEVGARIGIAIERNNRRQWLIDATYLHSVLNFPGTMYDYDWTKYSAYPKVPWSYTSSQDSTSAWQSSIELARTLFSAGALSFALYGYFRYQYAYHVENTLSGWQYLWNSSSSAYNLYGISDQTQDVLEYTISSYAPGLGLLIDLEAVPRLHFALRACYTPVYASDQDNHVLRTKLSTAAGWGNGTYADLGAKLQIGDLAASVVPYVAVDGSFTYYSISTTQTQYWYGNADASNGAPQGTTLTGISHVITSNQYKLDVRFGFAF